VRLKCRASTLQHCSPSSFHTPCWGPNWLSTHQEVSPNFPCTPTQAPLHISFAFAAPAVLVPMGPLARITAVARLAAAGAQFQLAPVRPLLCTAGCADARPVGRPLLPAFIGPRCSTAAGASWRALQAKITACGALLARSCRPGWQRAIGLEVEQQLLAAPTLQHLRV
jgi:hypothetical protein